MNDPFTNHDHVDEIAERLNRVAEHTSASSQFAADLEEKLRHMHQPKSSRFGVTFRRISPMVRWAAVMVLLGLVLSWSIRSLVPSPQPAANNTPGLPAVTTPTPQAIDPGPTAAATETAGYEWRGGKLFLSEPLPASPAEANVYLLQPDQPATVEEARLLAQRFGVQGEVYEAPGDLPNTTRYMITDGSQRLYVRSENYFTYYAEYNANTFLLAAKDLSDEDAYAAIDSFLKSHGFDFEYQVENESGLPGVYDVLPLTIEGHAIRFDHNMPARLQFTLGSGGRVISLDSSQIDYESVGAYGIRSAEEAFQMVLGNAETIQNGVLESSRSGGVLNESYWDRSYPDNQTVTIYGRVISFPSVEPGKLPFVAIEQHTVTGNTPPASGDQLIAATGQFHTEDGIRTFQVESWQPSNAQETAVMGVLQREGDQTVLVSDVGEKYVITDAPTDVPLNTVPPDEQLMVGGFLVNGDLVWRAIQYFPAGSNFGGGGGGGTGFYKLNLSGTPVPFPTPTMQPETGQENTEYVVQEGDTCGNIASSFGVSIQNLIDANQLSAECLIMVGQTLTIPGAAAQSPLIGRQLEKQRGMLSINIYRQQDGTSRPEFIYITQLGDTYLYATLENLTLDEMLPYQNRPLDIWGTVKSADAYGSAVITVDRFEDPYPGLQFQIIRGTQQNSEVDGNPVVLFTAEDGKAYVQMTRDGGLDMSIIGEVGDPVIAEVLIIPDETFGGYPVMRFFSMGTDSNNGEPADVQISADKPQVVDASLDPQTYTPPDTTIERVELVYYLPDPRYAMPDASAAPQYLQPAWRFAGHRSNGDVFEIIVQALKQDYLLPELQTYTPPG